jgi:hypothetical protein
MALTSPPPVNAAEALKAARATGIRLRVDGDHLVLKTSAPPPPFVVDLLRRHKAEIMALLRPAGDGWSADDWQGFYGERAAVAALDGHLPRPEAEAGAFACCVAEWLNRNPVRSPPERCLGCGGGEHCYDPLLPFGIESTGHAWLHSRCWPAWHAGRKAEATAALAGMGIGRQP